MPQRTSRETVRWLDYAQIAEGAIFVRLIGRRRVGTRLHADIISDIYKRVARWIGMPAKQVDQVSGHSLRVGATQDLLALNIDLASVMQAGRWKSTVMPMRYGEEALAVRGGMARAAEKQGRDAATPPTWLVGTFFRRLCNRSRYLCSANLQSAKK